MVPSSFGNVQMRAAAEVCGGYSSSKARNSALPVWGFIRMLSDSAVVDANVALFVVVRVLLNTPLVWV